jgi:hypothetical protein
LVKNVQINSLSISINPTNLGKAHFDLNGPGSGCSTINSTMIGCTGVAPSQWVMPSATNKAGWRFINCDQPAGSTLDDAGVAAGMVFANLPGQAGVQQTGPVAGQEYDIINCPGSGTGGAGPAPTFGQVITGIGAASFPAKLRYNGSSWTVCGV